MEHHTRLKSIEKGDWVWSTDYQEPVQILDTQELWTHPTTNVWVPSRDVVACLHQGNLSRLSDCDHQPVERLIYIAAAARVNDALNTKDLLAPLGGNLIILPHQIHALSRALEDNQIRYLLADEVGLGKTIEAGLIMRELKMRGLVHRVLIVTPKSLVLQWIQEMRIRFNEPFELVAPAVFSGEYMSSEINYWKQFDQVVCAIDSVKPIGNRRGWSKQRIEQYNRERFDNLVSAGWDLIIVDEAHRLGGTHETVARHRLGEGLARATPYILLLTATPHQGKTESFQRLLSILDKSAFPDGIPIRKEQVSQFVIRTEKRHAIDIQGKPLFTERKTQLVVVPWEEQLSGQRDLYNAVSEYVRWGYKKAISEKRNYFGFLMVLMQRLVVSSTRAIRSALERRLSTIQDEYLSRSSVFEYEVNEEFWGLSGQEQVDILLGQECSPLKDEEKQVMYLLSLARRCEDAKPDARAEVLLDWIYRIQQEEQDYELKFLIFTEFISTQEMIREYLVNRGFSVVCLNGTMGIDERQTVQNEFTSRAQILVSTDAGGEGLNLQFCHVVINYDLPWNPMRLEQRIGRVDRIGQLHIVRAINFVTDDTVEQRVRDVLEQKLAVIMAEFGVDKTSDILDSLEAETDFNRLYVDSILSPECIEDNVSAILDQLKDSMQDKLAVNDLLGLGKPDVSTAQKIANNPLSHWVEHMVTNYVVAYGGSVDRTDVGYQLSWPNGMEMDRVLFTLPRPNEQEFTYLGLEQPIVMEIMRNLPRFVPGQSIPVIRINYLASEIKGYWSLWRIFLKTPMKHFERVLCLFQHDDGRVLAPTARHIWDIMISDNLQVNPLEYIRDDPDNHKYQHSYESAIESGHDTFLELQMMHSTKLEQEIERIKHAFVAKRETVNKLGLSGVRQHRLKQLDSEESEWMKKLDKEHQSLPELQCLLITRIEGSDA